MKYRNYVLRVVLLVSAIVLPLTGIARGLRITNPYEDVSWADKHRHKASLHVHTKRSDGKMYPHQVIDTYKSLGYTILALTDHNKVTYPWKGFRKSYGEQYEDRDPSKLKMVAIQGNELSSHHHMASLWSDHGGTRTEVASLDAIKKKKGQAILHHPGRYKKPASWYVDLYRKYDHLVGMEIYNQGDRYKNDRKKWDEVLALSMPKRPVWAFSNDDMHKIGHLGRNWNVFLIEKPTEKNIREALTKGRFYFVYCPKGHKGAKPPKIASIKVDARKATITIKVDKVDRIDWISNGQVVGNGPVIKLEKIKTLGPYVRAMLYGKTDNTVVGTQPFGISKK